jgi:DNA-directed RNA polymerase subunit delta
MNRKIIDFNNLNKSLDLVLAYNMQYPYGYDEDDLITYSNQQGEKVKVFELKTKDCIYLVKISKVEGIDTKVFGVDDLDIDFEEE